MLFPLSYRNRRKINSEEENMKGLTEINCTSIAQFRDRFYRFTSTLYTEKPRFA